MREPRRCTLCGSGAGITAQMIEWIRPVPVVRVVDGAPTVVAMTRWAHGDRCRDRRACRKRVEAAGADWPVRDGYEPMLPRLEP
jgi:hypothetical protein